MVRLPHKKHSRRVTPVEAQGAWFGVAQTFVFVRSGFSILPCLHMFWAALSLNRRPQPNSPFLLQHFCSIFCAGSLPASFYLGCVVSLACRTPQFDTSSCETFLVEGYCQVCQGHVAEQLQQILSNGVGPWDI